jgi:hypothetical protein
MTRGQALLLGVAVLALGGGGYALARLGGLEGFNPGIAASALLMLVVLVWTASYIARVVGGKMTYMEQLQACFDALPEAEQRKLLEEVGQIQADSEL